MRAGINVAVQVRRREASVGEPCKSSQSAKCLKTELQQGTIPVDVDM